MSENQFDIDKRQIFGIDVCALSWDEAFQFASTSQERDEQTVVAFLNSNNANLSIGNNKYQNALSRQTVLPDGIGVDIASRLLYGQAFPANLNGTDFVPALFTYMSKPKRVGLVGAQMDVLENAVSKFKEHAPWHEFIAISDGYFEKQNSESILEKLNENNIDILLVALGSPAQEIWVNENVKVHHAKLVLTVGALFDFVSGSITRAPLSVRKLRMEWLYRFWKEPKRLFKRYMFGNPLFLFNVLRSKFFKKKSWI